MAPPRRVAAPAAPRPVVVSADLALEIDGEPARLRSEGETLVAEFAGVRRALRALRTIPFPRGRGRVAVVNTAAGQVRALGLDVEVRVRGRTVGRAGPAARPGRLERLLRLGEVEVYPRALARAALRR